VRRGARLYPTAHPTPRPEQGASRRGWRRWEAVRFLSPLEYLAAGWSERRSPQERPHKETAPCPHCKEVCSGGRSQLDTVIRTFAPGDTRVVGVLRASLVVAGKRGDRSLSPRHPRSR